MTIYTKILQRSFVCGMVLFAICIGARLMENILVQYVIAMYLVGLIYALVITKKEQPFTTKFKFIVLSTILYIVAAYTAVVTTNPQQILIVSPIAMLLFYLLYFKTVGSANSYSIQKGIAYTLLFGAISAILPTVGLLMTEKNMLAPFCIYSIFPLWQTLFAVSLKLSAKTPVQTPITNTSAL